MDPAMLRAFVPLVDLAKISTAPSASPETLSKPLSTTEATASNCRDSSRSTEWSS